MVFNFAEDFMTLYVGEKFVTAEINDGIDFQEAALMCLSSLARVNIAICCGFLPWHSSSTSFTFQTPTVIWKIGLGDCIINTDFSN